MRPRCNLSRIADDKITLALLRAVQLACKYSLKALSCENNKQMYKNKINITKFHSRYPLNELQIFLNMFLH